MTRKDLNNRIAFTFSREERLKSKDSLASLFDKGSHFVSLPLHFRYRNIEASPAGVQVAFSVPKKRFSRAVDRNRIKRLLREVYRHNKQELIQTAADKQRQVHCLIIYSAKQLPAYASLEKAFLNFLVHHRESL